jgi:hypothetical protein
MIRSSTNTGPNTIVSFDDFVEEMQSDLPKLWAKNTKVSFKFLQEYYGETQARVGRAVYELHDRRFLELTNTKMTTALIVPSQQDTTKIAANKPFRGYLNTFTSLQRHMLLALLQECHKGFLSQSRPPYKVRTNYFQLARLLNCSYGGAVNSVDRLVKDRALTKELDGNINTNPFARTKHNSWFVLTLTDEASQALEESKQVNKP